MSAKAGPSIVLGDKITFGYRVTDNQGRTTWSESMNYIYANTRIAFCVEPGVLINQGSVYSPIEFTGDQQRYMSFVVYYGWEKTKKTAADYTATQFMLWEYLGATLHWTNFTQYAKYKEKIQTAIDHHQVLPSFHNQTYEISVGETIELEDFNHVLEDFILSSSDGLSVEKDGNRLSITGTLEVADTSSVKFQKVPDELIGVSIVYQSVDSQNVATFYMQDILSTNVKVKVKKTGKIIVEKEDKETGKDSQTFTTFEGAEFKVMSEQDEIVDVIVTNKNGIGISKDLPFGIYKVQEIKAPQGYLVDDEIKKITVNAENDNKVTLTIQDQVIKGKIAIHKFVDEEVRGAFKSTLKKPLSGVTFKIISDLTNEVVDTLITDEEGYAISNLLPYGWYTVYEEAVSGYDVIAPFKVFVNEDQKVFHYLIENTATVTKIKIVKVDADTTKQIPVAGIKFKVKDADGNYIKHHVMYPDEKDIDEFVTGKDGSVVVPEKLKNGIYTIEEVSGSVPEGYLLNMEGKKFEVHGRDSQIELLFENKPVKGKVKLFKKGERFDRFDFRQTEYGKIYEPIFKEAFLDGVIYELYAREDIKTLDGTLWYQKGELVDVITTKGDLPTYSKELPLGKYTIKEAQALNEYIQDLHSKDFELYYENEVTEIVFHEETFWNNRKQGIMRFVKVLEASGFENSSPINENIVFGLFTRTPLLIDGQEILPKDCLLAITHLDENMNGSFLVDFEGDYYFKELSTDSRYQVTDEEFDFSYMYNQQDTINPLPLYDEQPIIKNELKRAEIKVVKKSKEVFPKAKSHEQLFLQGVEFELAMDRYFTKNVREAITDQSGIAIFDQLELGTYFMRESKTTQWHVLDSTIFEINVSEHNETKVIEVENALRRSSLEVMKRDKDTKKYLSGAEITLYNEDMQIVDIKVSDEHGVTLFPNLVNGTYYVKETKAPDGYFLSDEYIEVIISSSDISTKYKADILNTMIRNTVQTGDYQNKNLYIIFLLLSLVVICKKIK